MRGEDGIGLWDVLPFARCKERGEEHDCVCASFVFSGKIIAVLERRMRKLMLGQVFGVLRDVPSF